jgi:hypothetical protein
VRSASLAESDVGTYYGRTFVAGSSINARVFFTTDTGGGGESWPVFRNEYNPPMWKLTSFLLMVNARIVAGRYEDEIQIVDTIQILVNLSGNHPVIRGPVFRSNGNWVCEDEYGQTWSLPDVPRSIQNNELGHYFLTGRTSGSTWTIVSFQKFESSMGGLVKAVKVQQA